MITTKMISELREKTGAGIGDCKEVLEEVKGDVAKAVDALRRKGMLKAEKKASRTASSGAIFSYIHMEGKVGVLVEVNCETDFVAKTDDFKELGKDVAMQIAAMDPQYVKKEDIPAEIIAKEKAGYAEEAAKSGKPANICEKMAQGKLDKYCKDICLMDQAFIKDDKLTIKDLVTAKIAKTGENMVIRRFTRYKLGEK
jgi:elongation factor Ts